MRAILVLPAALVLALVGCPCGVGRAAEDAAVAAARARQDAVKTAMIDYERTEVIAKGAESEIQVEPLKPKTTVPDKEMTLQSTNRLVIDGVKVRIEDNHPMWSMPEGKLLPTRQVSLCDGSIAKSFYSEGLRTGGGPMGYILRDPRLAGVKSVVLAPITLTIRALQPSINPLPMGDMKPFGWGLPIGGVHCQEYVIEYGKDISTTCWLDPSKEYAVRRIRTQKQGRLSSQIDVTAYRHESCGWIPTSWVCNQYSSAGANLKADQVRVLEMRVNEPQAAEQFELQFPPATVVADARNSKLYEIQPDGSMREFSPRGERLPGSVPQPGAPWYQQHKWLIVGVAVILVVAGFLYAVRWRRGRPV